MQFTFKFILFFSQFYLLVFCVHFMHNCHSKAFRSIKIQVMNGVFIRGSFLKILFIGWVTIKDRLTTRDRRKWSRLILCLLNLRSFLSDWNSLFYFQCGVLLSLRFKSTSRYTALTTCHHPSKAEQWLSKTHVKEREKKTKTFFPPQND